MRLRLLIALACLASLAAAPGASAAPVVGVANQNAVFRDPYFNWLGIKQARVIAPWDVALTGAGELDFWLRAAADVGVVPMVSFQRRDHEDCRTGPCYLPSPREYGAAIAAFHRRWPQVRVISTWNEGNHAAQPLATRPAAAAAFYQEAVANCLGCQVVAAEVVDTSNMETWLRSFVAALPSAPRLWGLHNYGDAQRREIDRTAAMLRTVPGQVWLTETGGIVSWTDTAGTVRYPYDEERARAALDMVLDYAWLNDHRITRAYVYQWRAAPWEAWDSGVVRPDGWPRPALDELAARLKPAGPRPESPEPPPADGASPATERTDPETSDAPAAESPPPAPGDPEHAPGRPGERALGGPPPVPARMLAAPRRTRSWTVAVPVACPASAGAPCAVALRLRTRAVRAGRRTATAGSRRAPGAARPARPLGHVTARVAPGTQRILRVRLPAARVRLVRRGVSTSIAATVSLGGGVFQRSIVTLR